MKIIETLYITLVGHAHFWLEMSGWIELGLMVFIATIGLTVGYFLGKKRKYAEENTGEALVRQSLIEYCENRDAHVLSNITLKLEDGSTTQIDHILVSTNGIFVIETKHYNGWIFANPKSKAWTQVLYEVNNKFQNPIYQNYKHVKAIQKLFEFIEPQCIHNIVVFSGNALFKTAKPENVCYRKELTSIIEQYSNKALSLNRVQFCVGRLEYARLELTRKTDIEHQEYLTQKFGR